MVKIITFHFLPLVEQQLPISLCNLAATVMADPADQSQIRQLQVRAEIPLVILSHFLPSAISNFKFRGRKCKYQGTTVGVGFRHRFASTAQFYTLGCAHWRECLESSRANDTNHFCVKCQSNTPIIQKIKVQKQLIPLI